LKNAALALDLTIVRSKKRGSTTTTGGKYYDILSRTVKIKRGLQVFQVFQPIEGDQPKEIS